MLWVHWQSAQLLPFLWLPLLAKHQVYGHIGKILSAKGKEQAVEYQIHNMNRFQKPSISIIMWGMSTSWWVSHHKI